MDPFVLALAGIVIGQFALLWYRIGRIEGVLKEHCRQNGDSRKDPGNISAQDKESNNGK